MQRVDLRRRYGNLYRPSAKVPAMVDVPRLRFLMIEGVDPIGTPAYLDAESALVGLAHTARFGAKRSLDIVFPVMPLEALFWQADGGGVDPHVTANPYEWRLQILLPDEVSSEFIDEMRVKLAAKRDPARLSETFVRTFTEGAAVQITHIGEHSQESATADLLSRFAAERGREIVGPRHEIYLGDHTRAALEARKTVVRYGVRRAS